MSATEFLRQDHAILRAKIALANSVLYQTSDISEDLVETCTALVEELRRHLTREERIIARCRAALKVLPTEYLEHFAIEHYVELRQLHLLSRLLLRRSVISVDWVRRMLFSSLDDLCCQMRGQEDELFPLVDSVLEEQKASTPAEAALAHLHPAWEASPGLNGAARAVYGTRGHGD